MVWEVLNTLFIMVWEVPNIIILVPIITVFENIYRVQHSLDSHVTKYLIYFLCHQNTVNKENVPHGQVIS